MVDANLALLRENRLKAAELTTEVMKADFGGVSAAYMMNPDTIAKVCEGYSRLHEAILRSISPGD